jgi:hypothetical protein
MISIQRIEIQVELVFQCYVKILHSLFKIGGKGMMIEIEEIFKVYFATTRGKRDRWGH